eukprot:TRINITY_DN60731_c0_g1_i1.p1 TRINITY_DN60731_c0_g1~~TRINITY_DN60731_c0_g1_i1.p1  ORF type:complete len:335 (+),score=71.74 TRINITY_DN60731_c0_g1_i1:34-1005(+)
MAHADAMSEESDEDDIRRHDIVIVSATHRRLYGKLCYVQYVANTKAEIQLLNSAKFTEEYPEVIIDVGGGGGKASFLEVRKSDVRCLPLSALLHCPPKPVSLGDLIEQDWRQHSTKRFSPLRMREVWDSLNEEQRCGYLKPVHDEEAAYKKLAARRKEAWQLVLELLDAMPKQPKLTSYMIFCQEKKLSNPAETWRNLSPEDKRVFTEKSEALVRQVNSELSIFVEVASGGGWSERRAAFFPVSFNRCLKELLLCQGRKGSPANRISAMVWKQSIFSFLPFDWFLAPQRPPESTIQEVPSEPEILPARLRRRLSRRAVETDSE